MDESYDEYYDTIMTMIKILMMRLMMILRMILMMIPMMVGAGTCILSKFPAAVPGSLGPVACLAVFLKTHILFFGGTV